MASVVIGDYRYTNINNTSEAKVVVVDKTKTSYGAILSSVTIDDIECVVTNMNNCFDGCSSLTTPPVIPDSVKHMNYCFRGCSTLTTVPVIPNGVLNMQCCFEDCNSITTPPIIPNTVVVMDYCFNNCSLLTTAPIIPTNVTDMTSCFAGCESLVNAPEIPDGVTNMTSCFASCYVLETAPSKIPDSVTNMYGCFSDCYILTTVPTIPSNVTNMTVCFLRCESLQGDIMVFNSPTKYTLIFNNTENPITIRPVGSNNISIWQTIANEYSNVSVVLDPQINYTFLSSRRLTQAENTTYGTTRGVRIDMLLDCGDSYALTGMTPSSGKLYTIDGTQITFPYYSPNLLRCYLIYEPSSQVPTGKLTIQVQNVNTTFSSLQVYLPSTATISQFEQLENSETTQLAPQINNLGSIIFNPQGSGASTNVAQLVPLIYQSATGNTLTPLTNDNKTQINTLKSDNTLDIKHFVTTADNIQVTTDKTLQDVITECYEALET